MITHKQKTILLQNNILLFNNNSGLSYEKTKVMLKGCGFEFSDFNREPFLNLLRYCVRREFPKKRL